MHSNSGSAPATPEPRPRPVVWVRLSGLLLASFGVFSVYGIIGAWQLMASHPVVEELKAILILELLSACAWVVFGLGMMGCRRWAWIGTLTSTLLALSWWMSTGLAKLLQELWKENSWGSDQFAVGVLLPACLGFLLLRFLLAARTRACVDADATRAGPWILSGVVIGTLITITLFTIAGIE